MRIAIILLVGIMLIITGFILMKKKKISRILIVVGAALSVFSIMGFLLLLFLMENM